MRRRIFIALAVMAGLSLVGLIPLRGEAFEFDGVNLRMRMAAYGHTWAFGWTFWEQHSEPEEHPTAQKLRELGVLEPIREEDSQWLVIKAFGSGRRPWKGYGGDYVKALGVTSFGTAVTLPASEDLSENIWIKWALRKPDEAKNFWQVLQAFAKRTSLGGPYLKFARIYLEEHGLDVTAEQIDDHIRPILDTDDS